MKFVLESLAKDGGRCGVLELFNHSSNSSVATGTPFPLLLSKGGCVPHLTRETLDLLDDNWAPTWPVLAPLSSHFAQTNVLDKWGKGLASFCALGSHPFVVTIQDPSEETRSGFNGNKQISIFNNGNNIGIDTHKYAELVTHIQPSAFVSLCDGDTPRNCSNKRVSKSVSRTLDFLDSLLESEIIPKFDLIASIEGGCDLKARGKSVKESTSKQDVQGFLLDGFHMNGTPGKEVVWDEFSEVLTETVKSLPSSKPRFYFGPASPSLVFNLLTSGIDVFDTSYPVMATEDGVALVFPNKFISEFLTEVKGGTEGNAQELNLYDESHRMSFIPLVEDCCCHTCRNFTRAYIHHLLVVKEMLGKVLLSLHNLHHYRNFFLSLRVAIKNDEVHEFRKGVLG